MKNIFFSSVLLLATPLFAQPTDAPKPKDATKPKAEKKVVAAGGTVFVRVIHATIGAPAVDVTADGLKIASGAKYNTLTPYVEIKSGSTNFVVTEAGKTTPIAQLKKSLTKEDFFTLAIYGDKEPKLLTVLDSSGKETPDKAKVKVVHLSPGAPEVLVTASKKGDAADKFTKFVATPLAYEASKLTTKKAGLTNLQIRTTDGKIVKDLGEVNLAAGSRTTAFAIGKVGAPGENAFSVVLGPVAKP